MVSASLPHRLRRLRPAVAVGLLLGLGAALFGARELRFDFTPQRVFESDSAAFEELRDLVAVFGKDDNILLVHVSTPDVFQPQAVDYLRRLNAALAAVPDVASVDGPTTVVVARRGRPPAPLLGPGADLAEAKRLAASEPMIRRRIVSEDGRAALLLLRLNPDKPLYLELAPTVHGCLQVLEETPRPTGVEVLATGIPVARVKIVEGLQSDQLTFLPVVSLVFVVVLWVMFRDLRAVSVPLCAVLLSLIYVTGLMGATGEPVNIINNVLPVLIFVIGISDAIHLIVRYRKELATGREQQEALAVTIHHLVIACMLTSVTTAVGLGSLLTAEISILKRFGLYAAAGVLIAYVVTVVFVPLVFSFLSPLLSQRAVDADRLVDRCSGWLAELVIRRRYPILVVGALTVAGCLLLSSRVRVDNNVYEMFSEDDPVSVANARLERDFAGVIPISISVAWDEGSDPLDPAVLGYVQELQRWVAQPANAGFACLSLVDMLEQVNAMRGGGDPARRKLSETAAGNRQALTLLAFSLAASKRERLLTRLYAPKQRMLRITALAPDAGARVLNAAFDRIDRRLADDAARHRALGIRCSLTGDGPVASRGINRLIGDMFSSLLLAFLIILPTMCILLRSVRAGLLSMIPNVTPLLLVLGSLGLLGSDLRITSVIVFTVALGLAVDDTIHFMVRFREEWGHVTSTPTPPEELEAAYVEAIRRTFQGTGGAIVTTTVLLALGFGALLLSRFPVSSTFAALMQVTVVAALAGDLLLLPACLLVLKPFKPVVSSPA